MTEARLCLECKTPLSETRPQNHCGACLGKRVSKGKKRAKRRARPDGVDIDAIHFNPRWMKKTAL